MTDVSGNRRQPRTFAIRNDAPPQRTEGVEERRLDGILGIRELAQVASAVAEKPLRVLLVKANRMVVRLPLVERY